MKINKQEMVITVRPDKTELGYEVITIAILTENQTAADNLTGRISGLASYAVITSEQTSSIRLASVKIKKSDYDVFETFSWIFTCIEIAYKHNNVSAKITYDKEISANITID